MIDHGRSSIRFMSHNKITVFLQIPSALLVTLLSLTSAYPCTAAVYECMLICAVLCTCFNHAYYRYASTTFQCKSKTENT